MIIAFVCEYRGVEIFTDGEKYTLYLPAKSSEEWERFDTLTECCAHINDVLGKVRVTDYEY